MQHIIVMVVCLTLMFDTKYGANCHLTADYKVRSCKRESPYGRLLYKNMI